MYSGTWELSHSPFPGRGLIRGGSAKANSALVLLLVFLGKYNGVNGGGQGFPSLYSQACAAGAVLCKQPECVHQPAWLPGSLATPWQ